MTIPQMVAGWTLEGPLGAGKSATVYAANKDGERSAVKIFNPDLIERYGKHAQLGRIQRELSLVGVHHDHLVGIADGGECAETGLLYVVM